MGWWIKQIAREWKAVDLEEIRDDFSVLKMWKFMESNLLFVYSQFDMINSAKNFQEKSS